MQQEIKAWFAKYKRELPWRESLSPYQVWVSEVMLQQTRVSVVLPYYLAWMREFPTLEDLALAPFDKVLKCWEGLGYYSRVRNLHKGAQYVMERFGGKVPSEPHLLLQIPGIGPYTKGAILSFAFHQKAPAVDANVFRVMSRLEGIISLQEVESSVERFLEDEEPWVIMEALIELGALVCGKKPNCNICPLNSRCYAYKRDVVSQFPPPKSKAPLTHLQRSVAIICCQGHYLLQKVEKGVMKDLFEFPYIEKDASEQERFEKLLGLKLYPLHALSKQVHHYTRYKVELFPYLYETKELNKDHFWVAKEEMMQLAFSSGHKRIMVALT